MNEQETPASMNLRRSIEALMAARDELREAMIADLERCEPSPWPWWVRRHFGRAARRARQERALRRTEAT